MADKILLVKHRPISKALHEYSLESANDSAKLGFSYHCLRIQMVCKEEVKILKRDVGFAQVVISTSLLQLLAYLFDVNLELTIVFGSGIWNRLLVIFKYKPELCQFLSSHLIRTSLGDSLLLYILFTIHKHLVKIVKQNPAGIRRVQLRAIVFKFITFKCLQ